MIGGLFLQLVRPFHGVRAISWALLELKHSPLRLQFRNFKKTVIGQFALQCPNNHLLYAGYVNYALHKAAYANGLNNREATSSGYKISSHN